MPTTGYVDPYRAFNFKIEVQGITEGHSLRFRVRGQGHTDFLP